eukprot:UN05793
MHVRACFHELRTNLFWKFSGRKFSLTLQNLFK